MKIGQLRKAIEGLDDELEIVVRAWDDDSDYCGTIGSAGVHYSHADGEVPYFAVDCGPDTAHEETREARSKAELRAGEREEYILENAPKFICEMLHEYSKPDNSGDVEYGHLFDHHKIISSVAALIAGGIFDSAIPKERKDESRRRG